MQTPVPSTKPCLSSILRAWLRMRYLSVLNFLHKPLLSAGSEDRLHAVFQAFRTTTRQFPGASVLEIGPGENSLREGFPNDLHWQTFDIRDLKGVRTVGDLHTLSASLPPASFDFVLGASVLEHCLFPWKVIMEINVVLKPGGQVFLFTHPFWPPHELPWDFWRFPAGAFKALFNRFTGFEILEIETGLPVVPHSLVTETSMRRFHHHREFAGVSVIAQKVAEVDTERLKWDLKASELLSDGYPTERQESN